MQAWIIREALVSAAVPIARVRFMGQKTNCVSHGVGESPALLSSRASVGIPRTSVMSPCAVTIPFDDKFDDTTDDHGDAVVTALINHDMCLDTANKTRLTRFVASVKVAISAFIISNSWNKQFVCCYTPTVGEPIYTNNNSILQRQ